jgi:hypothetical protein
VPGVRLFSLQRYVGLEQLKELEGAFAVVDLGSRMNAVEADWGAEQGGPFMDTAAVIKNLDLFVTSDTAVAHLAGAMGVPVWVPMSASPGWQWMIGREDSPWYPTMRLFRQAKLLDWLPVFERIAEELSRLVPPALRARSIGVRVSPGELYERIAALEIEVERAGDEAARRGAKADLAYHAALRDRSLAVSPELAALGAELKGALEAARMAEERVRACEVAGDFGSAFVEQARAMASARERVARLRRRVDVMLVGGAESTAGAGREIMS